MRHSLFFLLLCSLVLCSQAQEKTGRPRIGLTLSGGSAKGLAHIGILKAIDSAGLKVDYITGTSMGSIIGGLYAIGYSADSIEKMAHKIDWDLLLSNQSSLRSMIMEEKDESGRYAVELPWENHKFTLPTGVLEGQELWLKLAELFSPVANEKDFSKFSIPFKCISTDIASGEAVVLSKGELVTAIRSSIAIPSVFTAIEYDGRKLVDGGIVRNFPVKDVKEMGADFVIGSNVATELFPANKILNALQVLLQVAFFREAEDRRNEVPLCDIYVPIPLENYTMVSFNQAEEIIDIGLREGRKLYPRLKKMADSLDAIYGKQNTPRNRLPKSEVATISSYEVTGLQHTTLDFFIHTMDLLTNRSYRVDDLARMVRKAFGTRYYNRIVYSLVRQPDNTNKIIFEVTENPLTFAKLGLHYNEFSGISIIANLTKRNFLLPNSRDLISVNIGENLGLRAEHLQYIGRHKNFALILGTQFQRFTITNYENYKQDGVYRQNYFRGEGRLQFSTRRHLTIGAGSRFEWVKHNPLIASNLQLRGNVNFPSGFVFLTHNSLDRSIYPKKGVRLYVEAAHVFSQDSDIDFSINGEPGGERRVDFSAYNRALLNIESYTPLSPRSVLMLNAQSGINFNYEKHIINEFSIGGLNTLFRNQVTFAGLNEGTFNTASLATFQGGMRYMLFNNTYLIGRANVLFNDIVSNSQFYRHPKFLSGYSLTFAYNFALGPLELSAMYSDQSKKLRTYINIGIPF